MPQYLSAGAERLIAQEVSPDSFKSLYPVGWRRLKSYNLLPDRVLAIRRGMRSGPLIGHLGQARGKYHYYLFRDHANPLYSPAYPTVGKALAALIDWHNNAPKIHRPKGY